LAIRPGPAVDPMWSSITKRWKTDQLPTPELFAAQLEEGR
jgi:hypothetical protein